MPSALRVTIGRPMLCASCLSQNTARRALIRKFSTLALSTLSMRQTPTARIYHRLRDGSRVCQQCNDHHYRSGRR